jgi:GNAT superfamily N-acetyltransferase
MALDAPCSEPYFNGVWNARLPNDCERRVDEILEPFKSSGTPVTWYVTPTSTPLSLGSMLLKHGLHFDGEDPGMALILSQLPDMQIPQGLSIELVENRAMLLEWIRAFSSVFSLPKDREEEMMTFHEAAGFSWDAKVLSFNGIVDGKVVGTSVVAFAPGAVALFGITVLDKYRGKGIGAAMPSLHYIWQGKEDTSWLFWPLRKWDFRFTRNSASRNTARLEITSENFEFTL